MGIETLLQQDNRGRLQFWDPELVSYNIVAGIRSALSDIYVGLS
jgi:hypothetical protein